MSISALALCVAFCSSGNAGAPASKVLGASLRTSGHALQAAMRIAFNEFEQPCLQDSPCYPDPTDPGYSPSDPNDPEVLPEEPNDPDLTPPGPMDPTQPYLNPDDPNDPSNTTCTNCENDDEQTAPEPAPELSAPPSVN
jgi:hypothetical protein